MAYAQFDGSDQWMDENKEDFHYLSSRSRTFIQFKRNVNRMQSLFLMSEKDANCISIAVIFLVELKLQSAYLQRLQEL